MRVRWVIAVLALIGAGVAVGWGLGLWDEPPPETAAPASSPKPQPSPQVLSQLPKKPDALDTAAWMLAHAQRAPPSQEPNHDDNQLPCGEAGTPCSNGRICLSDACVVAACAPSTANEMCALASGKTGRCCGVGCLDIGSDNANCGGCGHTCDPGLDCVAGVCQAQSCSGKMAGTNCVLAGTAGSCCVGRCTDKTTFVDDSRNCGGCGHACAPGLACVQSVCVDTATGRLPDFNCNEPGHGCRSDEFCVIDACYPSECGAGSDGQFCPIGKGGQVGHCCSGACHDLFSDRDNCRACGVRCPPDQTCRSGECR